MQDHPIVEGLSLTSTPTEHESQRYFDLLDRVFQVERSWTAFSANRDYDRALTRFVLVRGPSAVVGGATLTLPHDGPLHCLRDDEPASLRPVEDRAGRSGPATRCLTPV